MMFSFTASTNLDSLCEQDNSSHIGGLRIKNKVVEMSVEELEGPSLGHSERLKSHFPPRPSRSRLSVYAKV